ncbi:hypothetical protein CY35_04G092900 [Sphagnum magellanicum]|nr:hypothetical protein CY35_04G092900 [Sphagnum magellanicum]KAH9565731.1 hypothetical protein CY35_04G092900 [Sphagnum magellanicum]
MKAVMLGAQSIMLGINQVVCVGGMESMSNAPFYLPASTSLKTLGHLQLKSSMLHDGLWDPTKDMSMGSCAELCAEEMKISRGAQDDHAIASYERAARAQALGITKAEIVPVTLEGRKGQGPTVVSQDEECYKFDPEKLRKLRPVFKENGTITAGNSSSISDGAAVLLLTSAAYAEQQELPIMARICGFGDAAQVVDLANGQLLGLGREQINIHGGAVSLGHPIGASGARIIISLLTGLAIQDQKFGAASVCNGGGGASAIVLERDPSYRLYKHTYAQSKTTSKLDDTK